MLNIQENQFITGKDILILGHLDFFEDVMDFEYMSKKEGDALVKKIDNEVSSLVQQIIDCKKTPIIVGGGHNNAYGNLKGLSLAKKTPINVVNLDAHTDLRKLEERHSIFLTRLLKMTISNSIHLSRSPYTNHVILMRN
ncbi:arginase family protein [Balneicella halophila]|uniref:arginase family protein n=1 Tax=Balneicella halophila TaxID=1537566 RepID=UPI001058200F|nr:arginase family protein [Balneicella halophila]